MKFDWKLILAVAFGGAIGSVTRFVLSSVVAHRVGGPFPVGTLLINISGSFLLGALLEMSLGPTAMSPELRLMLTTGFCGGFTTFSAFSYETVQLTEAGRLGSAALYVGASVALSLAACFFGMRVARP